MSHQQSPRMTVIVSMMMMTATRAKMMTDPVDGKNGKNDNIIGDQVTWSAMELGCTDSNFFGNKE